MKRAFALAPVLLAACHNHFADLYAEPPLAAPDSGQDAGDAGAESFVFTSGLPCAGTSAGARLPPLFAPFAAVQHHVDANAGSDDGPGTADRPWKTLQKALDTLAPGETAAVHPGDYGGFASVGSGASGRPITLAGLGANGAVPVVHTRSTLSGWFVRLEGLTFDGATTIGAAPLLSIQGHDVEILGNEFRAAKGAAIDVSAAGAPPDRVHVVANLFHDGAQGLAVHDGADLLVASNVFHDHSEGTILLDPSGSGAIVAGNTMARGQIGVAIGANADAGVHDVLVVNDIITGNGNGGVVAPSSGLGNAARRNLLDGNRFPIGGAVADVDNTTGTDPQYLAPRNLVLAPTSPALGAADPAYTPVIDRDGRCRPLGSGPDLGAYEQ